jgi:hypothetical protein
MTKFAITVGFVVASTVALAQSIRKSPSIKVIMTIGTPIDSVFNYIVPVDLTRIFKRYKNLPAITSTSIKESWNKPGRMRTVYFEDGSTSKETLLTVVPHTSFSH